MTKSAVSNWPPSAVKQYIEAIIWFRCSSACPQNVLQLKWGFFLQFMWKWLYLYVVFDIMSFLSTYDQHW